MLRTEKYAASPNPTGVLAELRGPARTMQPSVQFTIRSGASRQRSTEHVGRARQRSRIVDSLRPNAWYRPRRECARAHSTAEQVPDFATTRLLSRYSLRRPPMNHCMGTARSIREAGDFVPQCFCRPQPTVLAARLGPQIVSRCGPVQLTRCVGRPKGPLCGPIAPDRAVVIFCPCDGSTTSADPVRARRGRPRHRCSIARR